MINGQLIIIGRTGIYELDEKIIVDEFYILPDTLWEKDEKATQDAQENALTSFELVEVEKYTKGWTEELDTWVENYKNNINPIFNQGYSFYLQGKNGIYRPQTDSNNKPQYRDFHNLIIDYIYQANS